MEQDIWGRLICNKIAVGYPRTGYRRNAKHPIDSIGDKLTILHNQRPTSDITILIPFEDAIRDHGFLTSVEAN